MPFTKEDAERAIRTATLVTQRLQEHWWTMSYEARERLNKLFKKSFALIQSANDNAARVNAIRKFLDEVAKIPEAKKVTADILPPVIRIAVTKDIPIDQAALNALVGDLTRASEMPVSPPGPQFIERYPDVSFPDEVLLSKRAVLTVQLLVERPPDVEPALSPELKIDRAGPMEVEVVLRALDFEIEGDHFKTIKINPDGDSDPVIFWVKPLEVGEKQLHVEFYQAGRFLGRVTVTTQVVEQRGVGRSRTASVSGTIALPSHMAAAPDLELSIRYVGESETLMEFELHSTQDFGYHHRRVGRIQFRGSPASQLENRFRELSQLARPDATVTPEFVQRRLVSLGNQLYDELFPDELKHEYWTWKAKGIRTIQITSEEPYIPWEMVKPYQRGASPEPFLCEQFVLARWLCGRQGLKDSVPATPLCAVIPQSDLAFVREELEYLSTLNQRRPELRVRAPFPSAWTDVVQLLEQGGFGILHFACHGNFVAEDPNESAIGLDGGFLRPSDVAGEKVGFAKDTPLVFINACETGRVGFALTRLGGWADRFVQGGCSAFIGSIWEVNDGLAVAFAKEFYDQFLSGVPLGEAIQTARLKIREQDPGNSTWLAYTLYGDPLSRVRFAGS